MPLETVGGTWLQDRGETKRLRMLSLDVYHSITSIYQIPQIYVGLSAFTCRLCHREIDFQMLFHLLCDYKMSACLHDSNFKKSLAAQ